MISRIGSHLSTQSPRPRVARRPHDGDEPVILVAHEILPSQAMSLGNLPIAGIVTETGGGTSHAAILARSRGIPAVSGVVGITDEVRTGDLIVVDGRDGLVLVRPDSETTSAYRKMQREFFDLKDQLVLNRDQPAISADGVAGRAAGQHQQPRRRRRRPTTVGATGVGLFRTEYLFLTHQDVPDEEEQYQYYRQVIEAAPNRTVTIRTLDLGGDKTVPYLGRRSEANPFMGWRSIRLSFEHPRLFERQIRAILRAGRHGKVSMLFPMITTLEELRHVNRLVEETRRNLRREGVPFGEDVKTGVMVEVPAAAVCIDAILRETDFISIGSNDLIQYLVAADRDNPKVAHLCEPLSPAIFKVLQMVLDACRRTGTPVTALRRDGRPAPLRPGPLRHGPATLQHEPGVRADDQGAARLASPPPRPNGSPTRSCSSRPARRSARYLTARLHEVSSALEVFDFGLTSRAARGRSARFVPATVLPMPSRAATLAGVRAQIGAPDSGILAIGKSRRGFSILGIEAGRSARRVDSTCGLLT